MTRRIRKPGLALAATVALAVTACAGQGGDTAADDADTDADAAEEADTDDEADSDDEGDSDPVTITWWHNSNNPPGRDVYEQAAADFMEANPHVTIEITAQEHEDMLTRLNAAFQSGDMPDIYMERGGGELVAHVEAGPMVRSSYHAGQQAIDADAWAPSAGQPGGPPQDLTG